MPNMSAKAADVSDPADLLARVMYRNERMKTKLAEKEDPVGAYLGEDKNPFIALTFSEVDGQVVAVASCEAHHKAVFLEESGGSQFYVRAGNTSRLLDVKEASEYINARWGSPALAG